MNEFAEELIIFRKRNNLDQTEMSKKLGVTRQTISNWENGKTIPNTKIYLEFQSMKEGSDG